MVPHIPDFPKALFEELETEKLQHRFLESLMEFQNVDRGSLWIKRPDGYHCIEAMIDDVLAGIYAGAILAGLHWLR